jgi:pyruvate dehydrogenase E1 component
VIIADGLRRMYAKGNEIFLLPDASTTRTIAMPPCRRAWKTAFSKACTNSNRARGKKATKPRFSAAAPSCAKRCAPRKSWPSSYDVSADVWSATSYKLLRNDALLHSAGTCCIPKNPAQKSYLETLLEKEQGPFIAVSDNMKLVPDQVAPWVPGDLTTLGTDGFGAAILASALRRFFEVDADTARLTA